MNNEIKFKSLTELYKRVLPALKSKTKEIQNKGMTYIHEEDIWNFLKNNKWLKSSDLDLGMMVNDIFNVDINELDNYVQTHISKYHRKIEEE